MSGSLNKVMLIGNVGRDPEIRAMSGGDKVANLSVATSERWKDKNSGEQKERTEWHRVVVWDDQLVGVIERYVKKGDKIYIEGELQTRKWTDQSGAEKYSTEVVLQKFRGKMTMLGGSGGGGSGQSAVDSTAGYAPQNQQSNKTPGDLDDEILFMMAR